MKISLEFTSMRDLLTSFPKFAELIGGDGSSEERFAAALADDVKPLVINVTLTDGKPITEDEKEAIKGAIVESLKPTRSSEQGAPKTDEGVPFDETPQESASKQEAAQEPPKKAKTSKSKAENEKPASEPAAKPDVPAPKETEVRKVFNALIQGGKRDKLKEILESFGASNFSSLKTEHYAAAIQKAQAELGEVQP